MADEIAKLGIEVLSDDIVKATKRLDKLEKQSRQNEKQNSKLGGSFKMLGAAVAAVGLGSIVRSVISTAASFEKLEASLVTVTGSADKAKLAMDGIIAFATETPYQVEQITEAFIKLKALGLDPSESSIRSYGNTASAMGKDLNQMIEAVADATTGEFERLKEFGIKSRSEGDRVKFTFQGVTTEVGKNAKEISQYLQGLGENQFAGAMEKQMDTLDGAFSNLSDTIAIATKKLSEESGFNEAVKSATISLAALIREMAGTENVDDFQRKINATTKEIERLEKVIEEAEKLKEEDRGWLESFFGPSPVAIITDANARLSVLRGNLAEFNKELEITQEKVVEDALSKAGSSGKKQKETQFGGAVFGSEDETGEFGESLEQFAERLNAEREAQKMHREEMLTIEMDYYDRLYNLQAGSQQAALDFTTAIRDGDYRSAIQHGSLMLSNLSQSSKKMFEIQKAFSLANAVATLPSAVIKSFENAGGYPFGIVPAALMAAQGAAQIQAIKSATLGGGGSIAKPSGGSTSPSAPVASGLPEGSTAVPNAGEKPAPTVQEIRVTVDGDGPHSEGMRKFAENLAETIEDMGGVGRLVIS